MYKSAGQLIQRSVALRKESVDRNFSVRIHDSRDCWSLSARRAWIEIYTVTTRTILLLSLSARRAWIEIMVAEPNMSDILVALRKESVDRNLLSAAAMRARFASLSARRAWIEILSE